MKLIYDGECPFCSRYVSLVRIKEAAGQLQLIDARGGGPEVEEIRARGLIIDEGMVLVMNGQYFHGDDCLNRLALLSTRSGIFNRINFWLFQSALVARICYPVLRFGRNLALRLLGKHKLGF